MQWGRLELPRQERSTRSRVRCARERSLTAGDWLFGWRAAKFASWRWPVDQEPVVMSYAHARGDALASPGRGAAASGAVVSRPRLPDDFQRRDRWGDRAARVGAQRAGSGRLQPHGPG